MKAGILIWQAVYFVAVVSCRIVQAQEFVIEIPASRQVGNTAAICRLAR